MAIIVFFGQDMGGEEHLGPHPTIIRTYFWMCSGTICHVEYRTRVAICKPSTLVFELSSNHFGYHCLRFAQERFPWEHISDFI